MSLYTSLFYYFITVKQSLYVWINKQTTVNSLGVTWAGPLLSSNLWYFTLSKSSLSNNGFLTWTPLRDWNDGITNENLITNDGITFENYSGFSVRTVYHINSLYNHRGEVCTFVRHWYLMSDVEWHWLCGLSLQRWLQICLNVWLKLV